MDILDDATLDRELTGLDGWQRDGDHLRREVRCDSFRAAIDTIVRIADLADEADHHPELTNVYDRLTIRLQTHTAGGITRKDVDLARAIDGVVGG